MEELFVIRRVSKDFDDLMATSPRVRTRMCLRQPTRNAAIKLLNADPSFREDLETIFGGILNYTSAKEKRGGFVLTYRKEVLRNAQGLAIAESKTECPGAWARPGASWRRILIAPHALPVQIDIGIWTYDENGKRWANDAFGPSQVYYSLEGPSEATLGRLAELLESIDGRTWR
ncbi:hypothetical protein LTR86_009419 [Recurvomyces mirabilis]|nr:hypothetical protein LTR86_009419 [Recurvomyces mirabilis]